MGGKPGVAFFDMDHTIIGIDCSVSWKYFLVDRGLAPEEDRAKADYYWKLYCLGNTPTQRRISGDCISPPLHFAPNFLKGTAGVFPTPAKGLFHLLCGRHI